MRPSEPIDLMVFRPALAGVWAAAACSFVTMKNMSRTTLCPASAWAAYTALRKCRKAFRLSSGALHSLQAILSFLRENGAATVYAANRTLSERAACAPRSITRHITELEQKGFLRRKSSANGKRYRVSDISGDEEIFGIDVTPLLQRSRDLEEHAIALEAAQKRLCLLRKRLQARCASLSDEGALPHELQVEIARAVRRQDNLSDIEALLDKVENLARTDPNSEPHILGVQTSVLAASDRQNGCQLQETDKEDLDKKGHEKESRPCTSPQIRKSSASADPKEFNLRSTDPVIALKTRYPKALAFSPEEISDIFGLHRYCQMMARMSGISSELLQIGSSSLPLISFCEIIFQILERAERIRNPGGYFRALLDRKLQAESSYARDLCAS